MPAEKREKQKNGGSIRELLTNRNYLFFMLICFLFSGATGAGGTYVPVLLNDMLGNTSTVGTILFLGTMMEIPIIFLSNRFMDKLTGRQLLLINSALVAVQFAAYSFCGNAAVICAVLFLTRSVSTMLFIMVTLKVVLDLTGGRYATTALALAATCKSVGSVVLTWIAGGVIDASGLRTAFILLLGIACATLALSALIRLPERRATYFSAEE